MDEASKLILFLDLVTMTIIINILTKNKVIQVLQISVGDINLGGS